METKKLFIGAGLMASVAFGAFSSTACSVSVSVDCGPGISNCNGVCADTTSDPDNCGGCGISCGGDECIASACTSTACVDTGGDCQVDDDCCELFCQTSNMQCGCIPTGDDTQFCNEDGDCCSGTCDSSSGYCQ
jgi:hypothetical protein